MKGWIRERDMSRLLRDQYILADVEIEQKVKLLEMGMDRSAAGREISFWQGRRRQVTDLGHKLGLDVACLVRGMGGEE